MKYIEETYQELRGKAADALRESRRYHRGTASNHVYRNEYCAYALSAMKLKNAMFRERCAEKGVEV